MNSLRGLFDNKNVNVHIIRVAEGKKKNAIDTVFEEIMSENIPNLAKVVNLQIQEAE